jgi:phage antirepressor YoqD-like protein
MNIAVAAVTMTSLELVDFINQQRSIGNETMLQHSDLLKKVPLVLGAVAGNFSCYYIASNGKKNPMYRFPKREACLMAMSYSYDLQAKVFDRMTELEQGEVARIPQTFSEALRLAAEQAEIIEVQQALIAQQKPAVAFVDRFVESEGLLTLTQAAKLFGIPQKQFITVLLMQKVLYRQNNTLLPFKHTNEKGYLLVKVVAGNGKDRSQTLVTPLGITYLQGIFPPKGYLDQMKLL